MQQGHKLKLTVNQDKTRICKIPKGEFEFLGYTFGRMYSPRTGQVRLGQRPSKKGIKRSVEQVHELTVRAHTWQETTELVGKLNQFNGSTRREPPMVAIRVGVSFGVHALEHLGLVRQCPAALGFRFVVGHACKEVGGPDFGQI